jgi:hypothetical protein
MRDKNIGLVADSGSEGAENENTRDQDSGVGNDVDGSDADNDKRW